MSQLSQLTPLKRSLLILLILGISGFRVLKETHPHLFTGVEWLGNYSPLLGLCLLGGMFLPRTLFWLPVALIAATDWIISQNAPVEPLSLFYYSSYALLAFWGVNSVSPSPRWSVPGAFLRITILSLAYYVIGNTVSWIIEPGYAKTISGWLQSQTVGLPQFPPSWVFLRNSLASEWLFAGTVVLLCPTIFRQSQKAEEEEAIHCKSATLEA